MQLLECTSLITNWWEKRIDIAPEIEVKYGSSSPKALKIKKELWRRTYSDISDVSSDQWIKLQLIWNFKGSLYWCLDLIFFLFQVALVRSSRVMTNLLSRSVIGRDSPPHSWMSLRGVSARLITRIFFWGKRLRWKLALRRAEYRLGSTWLIVILIYLRVYIPPSASDIKIFPEFKGGKVNKN